MTSAKIGFAAIIVAYPLLVYFGLEHLDTRFVALIIIGLALLRLFVGRNVQVLSSLMPHARIVVVMLLIFGALTFAADRASLLQYYPVAMNLLMFLVFFVSLLRPPSVIERIARITTPDLPDAGISYTRKVTMVWCVFFVFNGSMALYTTLSTSLGFWAIYNSMISYTLMGVIFCGEYLVRRVVKRKISATARVGEHL